MKNVINKFEDSLTYLPSISVSGICLIISFIGEYICPFFGDGIKITLLVNFAWISIILSGIPLLITAIKRISVGWISSPLLISIAMIAAIYIGDIFAGGEVAFIMAIGAWIEDRTVDKAKQGLKGLIKLVPTSGRRISIQKDGSMQEEIVRAEDLLLGDTIRVLPGENFPADGTIIEGATSIDQSIMTGESLPIDKTIGDNVFAGTINRFGSVDLKITKPQSDSSLQKMINLIKEAENKKAPTEKLADKWARWLVPLALLIAICAYFITLGTFGHDEALTRAVTVLVVFCPCALVLATPTSVVAAIGQATKHGVLIKSGEALENMGKVDTIAFDKTGTLTHGNIVVSDIISYELSSHELLSLATSVESKSEHPLGKAILNYSHENNIPLIESADFKMFVGKGVSGYVNNRKIICGNAKLIEENSNAELSSEILKNLHEFHNAGKASIIVADEKTILGIISMSDTIKENSAKAIQLLDSIGINKTVLLTGDNENTATYIANKVGITDVKASLLPEDKVNAINEYISNGVNIAMVGDGVNDAPSLKLATVGVAMGTMGSDIAIDAADIALMGDDISKISYIKKLSNVMVNSIKFNIILSLCINIVAVSLSVMGILVPTTGAIVHNIGSIFVVLNAGRLYNKKIE